MWYETCFQHITPWHIGISFFSAAVLRNTTYQNNSNVILEDIGEGDNALLCITTCCHLSDNGFVLGNWFFPNGTRVPSTDKQWEFYRDRGQMMVRLHRRRGGEEGIYRCEIPDAMNVTQTIYIGVYSESTGEWSILFCLYCSADRWDSSMVEYIHMFILVRKSATSWKLCTCPVAQYSFYPGFEPTPCTILEQMMAY